MFHVMLALPVLTAFGAMGAVVLMLMLLLLALAFFGVLLVRLVFRGLKWLLCLPLIVAAVGLAVCLVIDFPLTAALLFWGLYALCCLLGWAAMRLNFSTSTGMEMVSPTCTLSLMFRAASMWISRAVSSSSSTTVFTT